jgi:hypothetical protein
MITIRLTETEHKLLVDILERVSEQALEELVHTEAHAYRDALKEREQQTRALFQKISTSQPSPWVPDQQEQWP